MWEIESIGISSMDDESDEDFLQKFKQNVSFKERYEVKLPWKSNDHKSKIVDNFSQAEVRLRSLEKKLKKDPQLKQQYSEVF